jgi:hypothetical protein
MWADKFALVVGISLASLFIFFWLLAFVIVGSLGAHHLLANVGLKSLVVVFVVPAGLWSILRSTDFAVKLSWRGISELAQHRGSVAAANPLHG